MDETIKQIANNDARSSLIYVLVVGIVVLSGVVVHLYKSKERQNEKNFEMLVRSIGTLKDNADFMKKLNELYMLIMTNHGK